MGWVYAIQCDGRPQSLIKVGRTDDVDPRARMRALQTGQPDQLTLLHAWPCRDSRTMEHCMHQLLDRHHYRGEWYAVGFDQVAAAWARVSMGRIRWWHRLRWSGRVWARRVLRSAARLAQLTGLVCWAMTLGYLVLVLR